MTCSSLRGMEQYERDNSIFLSTLPEISALSWLLLSSAFKSLSL